MKKKNTAAQEKKNVWKIVSIAFILLFISIIAIGATRLHTRPSFSELTQEQKDLAISIVEADFQTIGNIEDYKVEASQSIIAFMSKKPIPNGIPDRNHTEWLMKKTDSLNKPVQVSLRNESTVYMYLVDTETQEVIMRSFTEWLNE